MSTTSLEDLKDAVAEAGIIDAIRNPLPLMQALKAEFEIGGEEVSWTFVGKVSEQVLQQVQADPWLQNHIHFAETAGLEECLEKLISQKYIALFAQSSHEAWNDYRRTSYPRLEPPEDANSSFNTSLIIPRRYLYPLSERNTNFSEYQKAIDQQGGHFLDVDTWVFNN